MKIKSLFVLSCLLVCGFVGCGKTDGPGQETGEGGLIVRLPEEFIDPSSRGVENPIPGGSKTTIGDARVFLMSGSAVVQTDIFSDEEITAGEKEFLQVPSSIDNVVVVANQRGADLSKLTSYSQIMHYAFTVASQNEAAGLEKSKTLVGEGKPQVKSQDPADPAVKEATIQVNTITSRLEVGDVTPGVGVETVELLYVYINNYYSNGSRPTPLILHPEGHNVWKTTPAAGTPSTDPDAFQNAVVDNDYTEAHYRIEKDSRVIVPTPPATTMCYAFHLFTGEYIPHLIVLVRGTYEDTHTPDGKPYFFGWVTFTKFTYTDGGVPKSVSEMEPNMIYKMGLTNGIKINAKDITDQPEKSKMDVTLNIEVAPWTEQTVEPEV